MPRMAIQSLMDHHVHLGVTGLRRTGKTVFLTSLIYQLSGSGSRNLDRFTPTGVTLWPAKIQNPQNGKARFLFATYRDRLRELSPNWPDPTRGESGCVLQIPFTNPKANGVVQSGLRRIGLGRSQGTIVLHLHDYPGEFLLDAGMKKQNYKKWSGETLDRMSDQCPKSKEQYEKLSESLAEKYRQLSEQQLEKICDDTIFEPLREAYAEYAITARDAGMEFIQPAMTLMDWFNRRDKPGQNAGPPNVEELPFVPLTGDLLKRETLAEKMREQYQDHVKTRVQPFVKDIRRCHTQLVLVDVLRVLRNGVDAYNDTCDCIAEILRAYHEGWRPVGRIKQVLFAATKADHAAKSHRANMTRLLDHLVFKARGNIKNAKEIPPSEWFTSHRATEDRIAQFNGRPVDVLQGVKKGNGAGQQFFNPGVVPTDWPDGDGDGWILNNKKFTFPEFEPKRWPKRNDGKLSHMNLDRVIWRILQDCF